MGLFPAAASRGASLVTMNIALPALIFANVIPAFSPSNISALGPLFVTAFTYQAIGFAFGGIIREICYVPRNFWQGIIVLSGMSNWGNLRELPPPYVYLLSINVSSISNCRSSVGYRTASLRPDNGPSSYVPFPTLFNSI